MSAPRTRTQDCSKAEASTRLAQAKKYLELAEVAQLESSGPGDADVAATVAVGNAVLAGIAAADALCCASLGLRSRGQDHHDAEALLKQIAHVGGEAASALHKLVGLKDGAHYGLKNMSGQNLKTALRKAQELIDLANQIVGR